MKSFFNNTKPTPLRRTDTKWPRTDEDVMGEDERLESDTEAIASEDMVDSDVDIEEDIRDPIVSFADAVGAIEDGIELLTDLLAWVESTESTLRKKLPMKSVTGPLSVNGRSTTEHIIPKKRESKACIRRNTDTQQD